jgi:quercetin dioxygenase-like cupin family protein
VIEVTYGPGESSPPHRHPCPVIGYVIEGEYRSRSGTEPAVVYRAGQSFYEAPEAVHQVSANASTARPVRFLAYFVCDRQGSLSVPAERP